MNTKEEEVKATWKIPRALLREFKHFAADDDTTVTALVITAMKEFAARRKSGSKKWMFFDDYGTTVILRLMHFQIIFLVPDQ